MKIRRPRRFTEYRPSGALKRHILVIVQNSDLVFRNWRLSRAVHAGQKRIPADLATQVADHVADDTLTLREIEVLRAIAAGNANKLIADKLSITEETVKGHVKNILSKLGANDRTHAVTIGLKRGIIEL